MANASSAMLRRGRDDDELELWLYLGLNSDARGSARWSESWWSYVHELSKNGVVVVACELGGGAAAMARHCGSLWWVKERQREGERARVSERGGFASLFSPCWPDQPGQHRCAATTRCAWPGHDQPRWSADLNR